jgi:hypothetical protein
MDWVGANKPRNKRKLSVAGARDLNLGNNKDIREPFLKFEF